MVRRVVEERGGPRVAAGRDDAAGHPPAGPRGHRGTVRLRPRLALRPRADGDPALSPRGRLRLLPRPRVGISRMVPAVLPSDPRPDRPFLLRGRRRRPQRLPLQRVRRRRREGRHGIRAEARLRLRPRLHPPEGTPRRRLRSTNPWQRQRRLPPGQRLPVADPRRTLPLRVPEGLLRRTPLRRPRPLPGRNPRRSPATSPRRPPGPHRQASPRSPLIIVVERDPPFSFVLKDNLWLIFGCCCCVWWRAQNRYRARSRGGEVGRRKQTTFVLRGANMLWSGPRKRGSLFGDG
mmetsp:Transcript_6925/g.22493  ORF Transcript_6925/g.22493 Transcript_6925/m.22493 type:complete len:291 (-) Transcript_6925:2195-3067(-)